MGPGSSDSMAMAGAWKSSGLRWTPWNGGSKSLFHFAGNRWRRGEKGRRRAIEIPENDAWKDKRAILRIGAADFFTDCWFNGVHLGHLEGGYTPFEFDLTDVLAGSEAT